MNREGSFKKGILADRRIQFVLAMVVLLGGAILTQAVMRRFVKEKVEISEAFLDSQVVTSESSIEMAGQYIIKVLTADQKREVIQTIADQIGLELMEEDWTWVEEGKISQVSVHRKSKVADTKIQLVSVNANEDSEIPIIHNYVLIRMEVYDQIESILNYKRLIQKAFKELEMEEESSYVQFSGRYPGMLTLESKNEIADQMIERLRGHVAYENRADDLYTVYAYSGGLPEYISVGKSKVNIQVSMTYNEVTNETWVYLATPIMNGSY